jgi:hypothetical protein
MVLVSMMAESRVKGLSGLGTFESFLDFWLAAALMSVKKLPDFVDRSFFERIKIRPRE